MSQEQLIELFYWHEYPEISEEPEKEVKHIWTKWSRTGKYYEKRKCIHCKAYQYRYKGEKLNAPRCFEK